MSDAPTTPAKSSIVDDFVDIWTNPAAVFQRRMDGKWVPAMLVLVVLSAVIFFTTWGATEPIFQAETARGMAARGQATPEQIQAAQNMGPIFAGAFVLIGTPLLLFLLGVGIWIATRIVGGTLSYAQSLSIACFAFFPRLAEGISNAVQALLMDESALTGRHAVSLGLGRFLNPDTVAPALMALAIRVDLFTLWVTVLVMVGIAVMAKCSRELAVMAGVIVWLLGALPTVLPTVLRG